MLSVYKKQYKHQDETRCKDFHLPLELIVEVLKKLPTTSLMRFKCVSKQWSTIISSRSDFIESIVARSLSQPLSQPQKKHPVFMFLHCVPQPFFTVSSSFSQSTGVSIPRSSGYNTFRHQYARGLICCSFMYSGLVIIYNPTTRQSFPLPEIQPSEKSYYSYCLFGYDPVMNQYKVFSMICHWLEFTQTLHVFTLGGKCWRQIQGNIDGNLLPSSLFNEPINEVCIDGTIYYAANKMLESNKALEYSLLSFDVRSESFDDIQVPKAMLEAWSTSSNKTLVNHLEKLGCICCNDNDTSMWIMENAEENEWSRIKFWLPQNPLHSLEGDFLWSGVTRAGEIIVVPCGHSFGGPLYVYYYNVKQNSFRRVEIECTRPKESRYYIYVSPIFDHVENTMWL